VAIPKGPLACRGSWHGSTRNSFSRAAQSIEALPQKCLSPWVHPAPRCPCGIQARRSWRAIRVTGGERHQWCARQKKQPALRLAAGEGRILQLRPVRPSFLNIATTSYAPRLCAPGPQFWGWPTGTSASWHLTAVSCVCKRSRLCRSGSAYPGRGCFATSMCVTPQHAAGGAHGGESCWFLRGRSISRS